MAIWYAYPLSFHDIHANTHISLCMVCPNLTRMGSTPDLEDTQVHQALHPQVCHRLQVAHPGLLDWVWVQLANPVLQILTQPQSRVRHRHSGLEVIQALIIRITGEVCSSSLSFGSSIHADVTTAT
jgi:hypothetical protein